VTPDMEQILLSKLTEVAQQQATAAQSQAVSSERMVGLIERMSERLDRAEEERVHQHEQTRSHAEAVGRTTASAIAMDAGNRDAWWRRMAAIIGVGQLLVAAALAAIALFHPH